MAASRLACWSNARLRLIVLILAAREPVTVRQFLVGRRRLQAWLAWWQGSSGARSGLVFRIQRWDRGEPELAVLNKNRNQRQQKDDQGKEHSAALLLFESRMWRGIPRLCATILLQHRHSPNSLAPAEPGTCRLVCLEMARKASTGSETFD